MLQFLHPAEAQYEDLRCKCVCPSPKVVNGTHSGRKLYIGNVPPNDCKCEGVILPQVSADIRAKAKEFCPHCTCRYESRNTTVIKVVVILIIGVISILVLYMLFLMCLEPLISKGRSSVTYEEHTDEVNLDEQEVFPPAERTASSVFNRVGLQTTRWKQTVQEQRRHIYDRHTMLN
ncbi:TMEM9 [Cordylochernes scorpioides]|uniref:TMEM9 n=1 Tax=Cordylochernes scorpioides TaxID=51811 RepID=A0ABY6KP62_9ARAC|nr:TMEM9 [Cordylochernes scorpioides]